MPLSVFTPPKVGKGCSQNNLQGSKETKMKLRWNFFFPNSLHHTTILCNFVKFLFLPKKISLLIWSAINFFAGVFGSNYMQPGNRWIVLQHLPGWDVEVLFLRSQQCNFFIIYNC